MGSCGCDSENEFFQVDKNNELIVEKFDDCPDCGGEYIQVSILKQKDRDCFGEYEEVKKKKLSYWMGEEKNRNLIIVSLSDFEDSIKRKASETFEAMWYDTISEKELKNIPEELLEKIESEFIRIMLIKVNEA